MAFFCPRLEINPEVSYIDITDKIKTTKGEIKDKINFEELMYSQNIYKNENFALYIKGKNFILLPNYYSIEVAEIFDIYGGIYNMVIDNIVYVIKIYFYKIKNPELITKELINKFELIFMQSYLISCNVLDMDYHSYRLSLFFSELSKPKFLNLSYDTHQACKTKLFRWQRHNISQLLHFHTNGIRVRFDNNLIMHFENGIIYDLTTKKFIAETDISEHEIFGGIVMDEAGTGKTLQFIIYLLEVITNQQILIDGYKALILVPNDDIKDVWISEFKKHIVIPLEELPICLITIKEFRENDIYALKHKKASKFMDNIKIIVVDEIHTLCHQYSDIFDKLVKYQIKYRWGLSATPFSSPIALFNIIKFLTGKHFYNERLANIPYIQNEIMKVFLKNTKANTSDEYPWPELNINNVKLKFDKIQQDLYDTESKTSHGIYNRRLLSCQLELMFNKDVAITHTPKELKHFVNTHYKKLYEDELEKLSHLITQLQNIQENKERFDLFDYTSRFQHFLKLIKSKEVDVQRYKSAYEYHMQAISKIDNVFTGEDVDPDEKCPICMCPHESPITYFKDCGHYFCKTCIDEFLKKTLFAMSGNNISCPYCRKSISREDIIIVKDKYDITSSTKCQKVIELINSIDDRFIIFTQFPKLIDNLIIIMERHGIISMKFSKYKTLEQKDCKVIILSSEENAAGIDLTEFNNVIIFEPFEDSTYCREIEKQLIGRVHRQGQKKIVNVFRLIMLNTIEEQIYSKFL
jgi:SNF2 family DNA or RNA helicase